MRVTNNMGKNSISFHKWQISGKRKVHKKVKLPNGSIKPFESNVCGDPYGNRTHDSAVKGRCLNLLTNGPFW